MSDRRVLIIDDDEPSRLAMRRYLKAKGYEVSDAGDCAEARARFGETYPDVCVVDYMLPDGTALDLLPWFRTLAPDMPVLVLTGHGSIDLAVDAVKAGAEQFLTKPVDLETLELIVARTIESASQRRQVSATRTLRGREGINPFLGPSTPIRELAESAARLARSESPVLIQGETGTGKTLLARWLHDSSRRGDEPFVDLNCGGLSREFLESELFGYEKGAFTGAISKKQGLLELGHRGTIFLDEIGDMDHQVQPKILKVLEEKRFRRMGSVRDVSVDVRLIAATHVDLEQLSAEGRFRADLFYRVSALPLRVPPLRERGLDIPLLARSFLTSLTRDLGIAPARSLSPSAEAALLRYAWPGNIRELRNVIERALINGSGPTIEGRDLNLPTVPERTSSAQMPSEPETLQQHERRYLESVLEAEQWRVDAVALRLGLTRSTLYYKIRSHGITIPKR